MLGLLKKFERPIFVLLLILLGFISRYEIKDLLRFIIQKTSGLIKGWNQLNLDRKILLIAGGVLFSFTLLQALTPPWDYDGLLYHLEGPKEFLKLGGIQPSPQNWLTYYPSTIEMLFTLGLGLGSEFFARLIHLTYAIILVLSTYSLAKQTIGEWAGWLAAFILVGIPIFPIWANLAYIDMGWAVYTFLATYSVINWDRTNKTGWLILAGIFMGFGLGSKYLAFGGLLGISGIIFLRDLKSRFQTRIKEVGLFIVVALIVGSPWYIKNLFWTGNPLYPLLVPPSGWSSERLRLWTTYMESFGASHNLFDYLLLPVRLFTQHEQFATFLGSIELPSFMFLLVLIYPLLRKTKAMNLLVGMTLIEFVVWSVSVRQTRYLLPIFPNLSVLTAHIISELGVFRKFGRWVDLFAKTLVFAMVAVTIIYSGLFFMKISPFDVLIGKESKEDFLQRNVGDYGAIRFIKNNLPSDARVLLMWDGRNYYCDERCIPDIDHSQWTELVMELKNDKGVLSYLSAKGITHLYLSLDDVDFILQHDPTNQHKMALEYFLDTIKPNCAEEVYGDQFGAIYALTCIQAGNPSSQVVMK